ncbi:nucleoside deaminase [Ammoniphilus sp. YIM 78166]|uniref:nucleoside deaminase n=1 Tax=Ammoniphilus sp. YIM 78166 TaxID=1644106 RepID=UPI00107032F8|nr:nucleoside deaminase [Ammoniphilus sp. YIM 78166]
MDHIKWMEKALQIAHENVLSGHGGPFGAVIVKDGHIVATGCNEVTTNHDPTAHAEVQAIRAACKQLNHFQLTDCDLYTSCEPCPMCIGAIYWSRPRAVYYACTKEEAAAIGFDDHFIYQQLAIPMNQRSIQMVQIDTSGRSLAFDAWRVSQQRISY